jgi:PAS domain-containing protein
LRGLPIRDADGHIVRWHILLTDIEARKQSEEKLRRSEMEFRQIVDLAPQLVGVFGSNLERLYANRKALDYHGVRLDEWLQLSRGSCYPA